MGWQRSASCVQLSRSIMCRMLVRELQITTTALIGIQRHSTTPSSSVCESTSERRNAATVHLQASGGSSLAFAACLWCHCIISCTGTFWPCFFCLSSIGGGHPHVCTMAVILLCQKDHG